MSERVVTVILGGGRGSRLYPLTTQRAKPAVPLGGKYRLIDIPLSNAINSGYRNVYVLTQFNSASLNRHVNRSYQFDIFSRGVVEILAAEQTDIGSDWYQGTADAVRKHFPYFDRPAFDLVLVLSGDHLYRMDYRELVARHVQSRADITVSTIGVDRQGCTGFGIMGVDGDGRIRTFREKPDEREDLTDLVVPDGRAQAWGMKKDSYLASMGVYVFSRKALREALEIPGANDFGKDVLPAMVESHRLVAHHFDGYWEDIGTIEAFFKANLALCEFEPQFRFWHPQAPIYTRRRLLPASKIVDAQVSKCILSEGCIVEAASLRTCVVGLRSRIGAGVEASEAIIMGADYYETDERRAKNRADGIPDVGIGARTVLRRAIIDKNARIGQDCVLVGSPDRPDARGEGWAVQEGIVVVEKNAIIPAGTVI